MMNFDFNSQKPYTDRISLILTAWKMKLSPQKELSNYEKSLMGIKPALFKMSVSLDNTFWG